MKETRKRGIPATEEGRQKLTTAKAAKRNHEGKVWTYLDIAIAAQLSESAVKRFFAGKRVDEASAISICKTLDLEVTDIVDAKELNPPTPTTIPTEINWREICNQVLATQHLRRQATAQQYELKIYVPLGLMERPKTPNPRKNATGEDSPPQKEPELQIVQTYKDDAFFQKVIAENHTEKRKHIAIIGEPGAGKTTLLGELADRLCRGGFVDNPHHPQKSEINPPLHSHNENFPICIRLADLRSSTIADYLLNNWLSKALQFIDFEAENVTPEIRKEFKQFFAAGKVWLLLDGVDEMAATSPIEALARIREQLTDWVGKARVVLTCRLNVWDAAISNTLTDFDTYKTLEFEPDDVDEFIRQWFEEASQDEKRRNSGNETFWREQGKRLTRQLKEPGKERIKELVRNPLRLSMLCQSWCVAEQELPETKAALYEQFTTYFFEWKQEEFQKKQRILNQRDKKQIQQALAKLALAAMSSVNRFRIEQDFAIDQMEEEWFNLADELGWLVLVDRDTRTKKPVYAFFHPTFQEYFAACAIEDWHFFLNHQIPPVSDCSYRIFEKQWREVILLWLGRGDVEKEQKEEFIKALVEFEDGCGNCNFYKYRAYFLASAGIAEFECSSKHEIVLQIVKWQFGYLDSKEQTWIEFLDPIKEGARETLYYTKRTNAVDALLDWLKLGQHLADTTPLIEVIYELGCLGQQNTKAITALVQLLESGEDEYIRRYAAKSLGEISPGNPKAVSALLQLIETSQNDENRMQAACNLADVDPGNRTAIDCLIRLIQTCQDENIRMRTAESLNEFDKGNPKAIDTLVELIQNSQNEDILKQTARIIGEIGRGNPKVVSVLIELLDKSQDEDIRSIAIDSLGEVGKGEAEAINALINLIQNYNDKYIQNKALYELGKIAKIDSNIEDALVEVIQKSSGRNEDALIQAVDSLGERGNHNSIVIAALQELIYNSQDEFTRWRAADSLLLIDENNPLALSILVELTQPTANENIRWHSARSLWLIDKNNPVALNTFLNLLYTAEDESTFFSASHILSKIMQNNFLQVKVLLNLLLYSINYHIFYEEFEYLKNILEKSMMPHVVKVLKDCLLEDNIYDFGRGRYEKCYDIIWHCAQNLPYPDFYQAWHQDTLTNTATANLNIANLPQVLAEAINNQPELCSKVKLICIDTHQFIDPENPAPEIYDLMLNQKCPEWQNGYPETMQKLKLYWNYLRRNSENTLFFICYDSTALTATPTGFSDTFLKALSKFDGTICVVWETGEIGLQTFSPSQPNLIADILGWMREKMMEE